MSENKRSRITSLPKGESVQVKEQTESVQEVHTTDEWFNEDGTFNWEGYEGSCITNARKVNPHIKTTNLKDRVFCRESYAQQMYDVLQGHEGTDNIRPIVEPGDIIDGKIYAVSSEWMTVDVNYREMVYVQLSKEPQHVIEDYKPGDEVSVLITGDGYDNTNNAHITGSVSGGMKQRVFRDLQAGVETADTAWVGRVSHMIENGGYIVNVQGVECFMPGSLAGINKLHDFESIIKQELYVVPVSFSPERGTIVVSHRKYLQAMIPTEIENLKATIDDRKVGSVTGTAKFGVFCEFSNCLTGMIHVNDLDEETMKKFKSREIKPGDSIEFWVKDIISNSKITLSQKAETIHNPWKDINSRFKVPCNVEATVKTKKDYGLFITVEEGLVGLLHVSELADGIMDLYNPGDTITVQINRIDKDSQKIFLKLPE